MTEATFEVKRLEGKQKNEIIANRNTARIAGVLFIIATATSLLSVPFLGSIKASNYLSSISANGNAVLSGILLLFIGAFASASNAITLYPVFSRYEKVQRRFGAGSCGFQTKRLNKWLGRHHHYRPSRLGITSLFFSGVKLRCLRLLQTTSMRDQSCEVCLPWGILETSRSFQ
jgi:Domain of unknown function (DUF4386)